MTEFVKALFILAVVAIVAIANDKRFSGKIKSTDNIAEAEICVDSEIDDNKKER